MLSVKDATLEILWNDEMRHIPNDEKKLCETNRKAFFMNEMREFSQFTLF